jgi:hypothetical protein
MLAEVFSEGIAPQQFHRKEKYVAMCRMAMMSKVVHTADVRMGYPPSELNFSLEPDHQMSGQKWGNRDCLQCNSGSELSIFNLVDFSHPALRDELNDLVSPANHVTGSEERKARLWRQFAIVVPRFD